MNIFSGVETVDGYEPSWLYKILRPKKSGNTINGLGETESRRPTPIYHRYDHWHPWILYGITFMIKKILTPQHRKYFKRMNELDNQGFCDIAPSKIEDAPESWTKKTKQKALSLPGCDVVGIAKVDPLWVFDHDHDEHEWIIVIGLSMDYKVLKNNMEGRTVEAEVTVLDTYIRSQEAAFELADWIRQQSSARARAKQVLRAQAQRSRLSDEQREAFAELRRRAGDDTRLSVLERTGLPRFLEPRLQSWSIPTGQALRDHEQRSEAERHRSPAPDEVREREPSEPGVVAGCRTQAVGRHAELVDEVRIREHHEPHLRS